MTWLDAFLLTCVIELPIAMACANATRRRRAGTDSLAANLVTHPTAWYLANSVMLPWLAVEIAVLIAEVLIYRHVTRLTWARASAAGALANGVTAALSFFV